MKEDLIKNRKVQRPELNPKKPISPKKHEYIYFIKLTLGPCSTFFPKVTNRADILFILFTMLSLVSNQSRAYFINISCFTYDKNTLKSKNMRGFKRMLQMYQYK